MFKTLFTAGFPKPAKMSSKSETVPGMAKSVRDMYEKYVSLGVPLPPADEEGMFDNETPVDAFGVELEDMSSLTETFNNKRDEVQSALKRKSSPPQESSADSGISKDPSHEGSEGNS